MRSDAVTVFGQFGGLPSHGVDCHDRIVHRLRHSHLFPSHAGAPHIREGASELGSPLDESHGGLGGGGVGGQHHRALLLARALPSKFPVAQLLSRGCWGCLSAGGLILALQRPEMVQGPSAKLGTSTSWG